jgi:tRNA(fMet)-specific endonuclease VapC
VAALIDTRLFIAAERGLLDLAALLETHPDESFAISVITLSELWHGVHRADTTTRRAAREGFVRSVADGFPVVPFDAAAGLVHARIWAELASRGALIGAHDLIVAATALATASAVVTRNFKHFRRVAGLQVIPA